MLNTHAKSIIFERGCEFTVIGYLINIPQDKRCFDHFVNNCPISLEIPKNSVLKKANTVCFVRKIKGLDKINVKNIHAINRKKDGGPKKKEKVIYEDIHFKITPEQKARYLKAAKTACVKTLSALMRNSADEVCTKGFRLTDYDRRSLATLDDHIRIVGLNINQTTTRLSLLVKVPQDRVEFSADDLV